MYKPANFLKKHYRPIMIAAAAALSIFGSCMQSNRLNRQLTELKTEFENTCNAYNPKQIDKTELKSSNTVPKTVYDYGGRLDKIVKAKNDFLHENGAHNMMGWWVGSYGITYGFIISNPINALMPLNKKSIETYSKENSEDLERKIKLRKNLDL